MEWLQSMSDPLTLDQLQGAPATSSAIGRAADTHASAADEDTNSPSPASDWSLGAQALPSEEQAEICLDQLVPRQLRRGKRPRYETGDIIDTGSHVGVGSGQAGKAEEEMPPVIKAQDQGAHQVLEAAFQEQQTKLRVWAFIGIFSAFGVANLAEGSMAMIDMHYGMEWHLKQIIPGWLLMASGVVFFLAIGAVLWIKERLCKMHHPVQWMCEAVFLALTLRYTAHILVKIHDVEQPTSGGAILSLLPPPCFSLSRGLFVDPLCVCVSLWC